MPTVKQRVFQAMREAHFAGPQALAKRAGIATSTIHRLGRGKGPPDTKTLEAIAKATGKDIDWLLGREPQVEPADFDRLVRSIDGLVLEMRLEREREQDAAAAMMRAAKALARVLRPSGSPGSTERPVPDGTAR